MQNFVQNKTSSTIAKRTIINFKKSKSIAKSINVSFLIIFRVNPKQIFYNAIKNKSKCKNKCKSKWKIYLKLK
jgi:hypothetical protein